MERILLLLVFMIDLLQELSISNKNPKTRLDVYDKSPPQEGEVTFSDGMRFFRW